MDSLNSTGSIRGNIMMFGDESTHPIICYNVITNPTFISNIMSIGEFKYNQFKPASALGKNSKKKKASSFDSHSAMGLAHALENKDVTVMNLSDHGINDAIAKYIAISLVKCNKIIKLDLSRKYPSKFSGHKRLTSLVNPLSELYH